jgi:hypothetical protein
MAYRIGRGSLTERWEPRPGACPNIRGWITIDRDFPARGSLAIGLDEDDRRRRVGVGPVEICPGSPLLHSERRTTEETN